MSLTLPVVTSAALLDSINPCAISVLLLTIGFLVSLEKSRRQILAIAGLYIFGIFLVYILIGLGVLQALTFFGIPRAISRFGALAIIITGLISLGERFVPHFPISLSLPKFTKPGIAKLISHSTMPAAFLLGAFVGLFEFPCTGGPYLLILSLLHGEATFYSGALYLIYYNLIFISPLVLILLLSGNPSLHGQFVNWRKSNLAQADLISSLVMILLGIAIFFLK